MIRLRNAGLEDLKTILDWAAGEGWNPGLADAEAFFAADPNGFFVADEQGTPVAAISVVNHSADFAFLGLYIVRPEYRGQGVGFALWQHAMAHAGPRTIGLDGVQEQQSNYARSGFALTGTTTRFSGQMTALAHQGVRLAKGAEIEALVELEATLSGVRKPAYLRSWFQQGDTRQTLVAADDSGIQGFCTVRACRAGAKVGPLVADTLDTCVALLQHAAHGFGPALIIDVPEPSAQLAALCRELGFEPGFSTARMYRGTFSPAPPGLFAVATLELG